MSIYLMDDRLHPSGGTRGAAQVALRSSAFGGLRLEPGLLTESPHDAGFHILILEINVFNKRSAPQMKCSSSEALITPFINTICMITFLFPIK